MNRTEGMVSNLFFFTKEEYETFLKETIGEAQEDDFPIVIESKGPGVMEPDQMWEFENMIEEDTGLHTSIYFPSCSCCGGMFMICIIYK